MVERLTNQDVSALLTLMSVGRAEISNTELDELTGIRITGDVLKRLNAQELIVSERTGNKPYVHVLTKKGLVRCRYEFTAERPQRPGYFGYAFYALLKGLDGFLDREHRTLEDMFRSAGTSQDLETRIRTAYGKLARESRDWVRLADLRPLLNGVDSTDVDGALKAMSRAKQAHLAPDPDRKSLTSEDRAAAVRFGGEDNHLLTIEPS
jgi:hypothetical protein